MSRRTQHVRHGERSWELEVSGRDPELEVTVDDETIPLRILSCTDGEIVLLAGERVLTGGYRYTRDGLEVSFRGSRWLFEPAGPEAAAAAPHADPAGSVVSPMTGKVIEVLCGVGDRIEAGAPLVVVEAMKMEHRVEASAAARVSGVSVSVGDQVDIGQVLVSLEPPGVGEEAASGRERA